MQAHASSHRTREYLHLADLAERVGKLLGTSAWVHIDQGRIDAFAQCTGDLQWIHIDPARAAQGPFGTTIAHGFLTLSLLPMLGASAYAVLDARMGVNYGLNRVRFTSPVAVNSRVRGHFDLVSFKEIQGGAEIVTQVTIEREGHDKPVCVAEAVGRRYV